MKKLTGFFFIMLLISSCAVRRQNTTVTVVGEESYFAGWLIRLDDRKEASFADCATGIRFPVMVRDGQRELISKYKAGKPEGCDAVFAEFRGRLVKEGKKPKRAFWNSNSLTVEILQPVEFSRYADCNKEFLVPGIYSVSNEHGLTEIRLKPDYTYTAYNFTGETEQWESYGRWTLESMSQVILRPEAPFGKGIGELPGSMSLPEVSQPKFHPFTLELDPQTESLVKTDMDRKTYFNKVYIR